MTARDRGPEREQVAKAGKELERRVADAYRAMGARKVEHDIELGGHQIDVYAELETADRSLHRIAVEVKDYTSPVGIKIIADFSDIVDRLRRERLIDAGVVVSAGGFSRPARSAAKQHDIRLLESADLDVMLAEGQVTRPTASSPPIVPTVPSTSQPEVSEEEGKQLPSIEIARPDKCNYDAFISYSHRDQKWVRGWLLPRLEDAGLRAFIDFRDFEPGAPLLTEMERAVLESWKTLMVLTPDYLASEWAEFENILASTLDPAARRRRVIPLLLKPCELPLRIRTLTYLDFTGAESEFEFQRLVTAIGSELTPDAPRHVPEPRVVSGESREPSASDDQHLRDRKESLEKELAETVADMAKVEKQYRATTSVIERNKLDQELESLREHRERVRQEYDSVCHILPERPSASQPGSPKTSDLRLLVIGPAGEQSTSHLEFSIPAGDSSKKVAGEIAFHLYLDNPGPTMVHYVDVEMYVSSDTDAFWTYDYRSKPFDIVESPRPWQTTLSNTYIHCRFVGGGDFACDGEVQQNLGLVKMLVPYGQADTTLTFQHRILAKGHKSQGSFAITLKAER